MKFTRAAVTTETPTSPSSTTKTTIFPAITDLVFGNTSTASGSKVALPAAYNLEATFEQDIFGFSQVYLHMHVINLGGGGLTGITSLIEFQDFDHTDLWFPSKEPAIQDVAGEPLEVPLRVDSVANNEWVCNAVGHYILASRVEHQHFSKFRARFRKSASNADANTVIRVGWSHNGGRVEYTRGT